MCVCVYIILYINVWTHKSHTSHSFHLYFVFVVFFLLVLFVFSSSSSFLAFIIFLFCSHISFDMHSMASNSVYGKLIHIFSSSLAPSCAFVCVYTHTQTHTNSFRSSLVSHTWKAHTFPLCNRWKCLPWCIYIIACAKINNTLIVICTQKETPRNAQNRWIRQREREEDARCAPCVRTNVKEWKKNCSEWIGYKTYCDPNIHTHTQQNVYAT